jgi:DNA-binding SARP family transcriptional activator/tetratricopeptide (TPR) repeat protein
VVEFRVLGDVEVRVDGRLVDLGHARQRCVLVTLLVEANRVVSAEQLVDRVWGERPPPRARDTLYSYLTRLRHALSAVDDVGLVRQSGGYVLRVDSMVVDLHRFHHLVARARAAQGEDHVLSLFEQALGLWEGEAFAGLDTAWLNALREALERERLAVELDCNDLQLRRGQHAWLLAGLSSRAAAHSLDERLAGQLMLALYRCGRQVDALEHFRQMRVRLAEELGIDPGPALQRLHEQILTADPALAVPTVTRSVSASAEPPVPRQLPADVDAFTGRAQELAELDRLLSATAEQATAAVVDRGSTAVVITAVSGTAGVGKTALALRWAHQVRGEFPDGQLYVNLRGYDPDQPLSAADALAGFLRALGVAGAQIPLEVQERAALYRSLLDGRRMLIVLDNAATVEQVRPLLPGTPSALVVVTSRDSLVGLVARHGARRLDLDLLPPEDAVVLLRALIGGRVEAEPDAAAALAGQCARLPLALRVAAELAATRPTTSLAQLVGELMDEQRRLELLDAGGDPRTAVRAVFSWSYQHLPADAARAFRLLGLHPGPDLDPYATAALTHTSVEQAQHVLDLLARGNLVQPASPGRYGMHDLLRAYASHLATSADSEQERRVALTRLFDHYLATAGAAMNTLIPAEQHRRPRISPPGTPTPPVADPTAARAWLDAERDTLTAVCAHTAARGWPGHTTELASTLFRYLEVGGHYPDAVAIQTHARHAADLNGDRSGEARALDNLGLVYRWQGSYQQAAEHHQQALTLFREIGDRSGEADALGNLGLAYWNQGHFQQAVEHQQQALILAREIGDRYGEASALTSLGFVYRRQGYYPQAAEHHQQGLTLFREIGEKTGEAFTLASLGLVHCRVGRYEQAAEHHQQSLALFREIGDRAGEAYALGSLGLVYCQQGRYQQAAEHHQQSLILAREIGDRASEAYALDDLGAVYQRQGHHQLAAEHHQQALTRCREIGERPGEAKALNGVGETHHATGHLEQARSQHTAALTLASQIGDRYEQARAHNGLAHTHHATGELDQAHHHWSHALALYTDLGVPDADDVHTHLAALRRHGRTSCSADTNVPPP